jgi:hypothetical protein
MLHSTREEMAIRRLLVAPTVQLLRCQATTGWILRLQPIVSVSQDLGKREINLSHMNRPILASGSTRYPAAICGLFGLRYTSHTISTEGIAPCCRWDIPSFITLWFHI